MNNPERVEQLATPPKALRYLLSNLLGTMGSVSFDDPREVAALKTQLSMTLWACDDYITHLDRQLDEQLARVA